jgi:hypothetical protein
MIASRVTIAVPNKALVPTPKDGAAQRPRSAT